MVEARNIALVVSGVTEGVLLVALAIALRANIRRGKPISNKVLLALIGAAGAIAVGIQHLS